MPRHSKWEAWEGAFRAAGEGPLGLHYGSHVWVLEAAKNRRESLAAHLPRTWVETFTDGAWKRVGEVVHSAEPTLEST